MSERYWEGRWRDQKADNENLCIVLAQKDNEIYELRQHLEGQRYKVKQLQEALDQGRIRDQGIIDEAITAATKVKDARILELRAVIEEYERERISRLGGIGSPA